MWMACAYMEVWLAADTVARVTLLNSVSATAGLCGDGCKSGADGPVVLRMYETGSETRTLRGQKDSERNDRLRESDSHELERVRRFERVTLRCVRCEKKDESNWAVVSTRLSPAFGHPCTYSHYALIELQARIEKEEKENGHCSTHYSRTPTPQTRTLRHYNGHGHPPQTHPQPQSIAFTAKPMIVVALEDMAGHHYHSPRFYRPRLRPCQKSKRRHSITNNSWLAVVIN
ncbi:hypothetical protein EDD17DRAFT_697632 [Pisolithus thermaeus]|nr:hypothetical protein EDD17DRAFT_697632 [Pisolithus thermaeus]